MPEDETRHGDSTSPVQNLAGEQRAARHVWPHWLSQRALLFRILVPLLVVALIGGIVYMRFVPRPSGKTHNPCMAISGTTTSACVREFKIPTAGSKPFDITRGSDGNLWFTEFDGDKIGRITPRGVISEFAVPSPAAGPYFIVAGPDGNLWFTEYHTNKIGRITPTGTVTEFALPDPNASALGITAGPDGNLWATIFPNHIDRIAPDGTMHLLPLPVTPCVPFAITRGPDGNLWFSYDAEFTHNGNQLANDIGRMTPTGIVTNIALPTSASDIDGITTGPDGNLWFTDYSNDQLGSISPGGMIHEFPNHSPYASLNDIAAGPDGNLWFTQQNGVIGRLTRTGIITTMTLSTPASQPDGITAGPGNTIWFTETGTNQIGAMWTPLR